MVLQTIFPIAIDGKNYTRFDVHLYNSTFELSDTLLSAVRPGNILFSQEKLTRARVIHSPPVLYHVLDVVVRQIALGTTFRCMVRQGEVGVYGKFPFSYRLPRRYELVNVPVHFMLHPLSRYAIKKRALTLKSL